MALSANAFHATKPTEIVNCPVKTGATIYNESLLMAATTSGGAATPYDGTIGAILLGWHFGDVNDDASSSPGKSAKIAVGRFVFKSLTVAGLSGTSSDIGVKVYATDDGTYTISNPTTHTVVVGNVCRHISSSVCDVKTVADIFGTVGV